MLTPPALNGPNGMLTNRYKCIYPDPTGQQGSRQGTARSDPYRVPSWKWFPALP